MSHGIGWQAVFPEILAASHAARSVPPFDEQARSRAVAERVTAARKFPFWLAVIGAMAFVLPNGWFVGIAVLGVFALLVYRAIQRASALAAELAQESHRLRAAHALEVERLRSILVSADRGSADSLRLLLTRWHQHRPQSLRQFVAELGGTASHAWMLGGHAVRRDDIPSGTPRRGRGGRTVFDKRKASDIDEDLAEINAAAVLSLLTALFSGPSPKEVAVRVDILNPVSGERIPWVTLSTSLHQRVLQDAMTAESPVGALRRLGGDVGRCRNQRLTPAKEPQVPTLLATAFSSARANSTPANTISAAPTRTPSPPLAASAPSRTTRPAESRAAQAAPPQSTAPVTTVPPAGPVFPVVAPQHDYRRAVAADDYSQSLAEIPMGESAPEIAAPSRAIPRPPAGFSGSIIGLSSATPSPRNVNGEFSTIARKFAAYPGDPSAPFVPFKAYYSQYAHMDARQLRFFFRWRATIRRGEVIPTDLSYIFVHTYELLHLIGAENATHAAVQIERLWSSYRDVFPAMDAYLVRWAADLYAAEVGTAAALSFVHRAVAAGASVADESLIVTDQRWAVTDYAGMPAAGIAMLVGERRLGDNKFFREHNAIVNGHPWVEGAYREAMLATDRAFEAKHGKTLRDAAVDEHGMRAVTREAFQGAVYDWKRKTVALGRVPAFTETSRTVALYRNAVRYAENLLRKERSFSGKLRGIELDSALAKAIDAQIAAYIRTTKPRTRVTLDLTKTKDLARESADVRARLLDGIEEAYDPTPRPVSIGDGGRPPETPSSTYSVQSHAPADLLAAGLLTDLPAVQSAIATLSIAARAILAAVVANGFEVHERSPLLTAAAGGALIAPLVDEINERAVASLGDVLCVYEGKLLILQEDYRDEVCWALQGNLDGLRTVAGMPSTSPVLAAEVQVASGSEAPAGAMAPSESIGPVEVEALALIVAGGPGVSAALLTLAAANASTLLLLVDRVNGCGLESAHGDILVDGDAEPPVILDDAMAFVVGLLARTGASVASW